MHTFLHHLYRHRLCSYIDFSYYWALSVFSFSLQCIPCFDLVSICFSILIKFNFKHFCAVRFCSIISHSISPALTVSLPSLFPLFLSLYLCVVLCFSPCYDCAGCVRQFLFTVLSICAALVTYFYLCSHFAPSSTPLPPPVPVPVPLSEPLQIFA